MSDPPWPPIFKVLHTARIRLVPTSVIIQILQCRGVGVDQTEMVLQPAHLRGVPGLLQLPQPGYLVHQLPLLGDPQSSEVRKIVVFIKEKLLFPCSLI